MRIILGIIFGLFATNAQALCSGADFSDRLTAEERIELAAAIDATPFPKGLVWQATQGDKQITLVGTVHVFDPRLELIFARVSDAISTADLVLLEATDKEEALIQAEIAANPDMIFITDGPTLPEQLSEETWNAVIEATRARAIPTFLAAKMKPWYLSLTLAFPPCAMQEIASGSPGLDHMISSEAIRVGTPQQALEPYSTLFDLLRDGTDEEQLDFLKLSLLAADLQSEMFVGMLNSYFAEDVAEIWEVSRISARYAPNLETQSANEAFTSFEHALLDERNKAWIPVIQKALETHDTAVIAVGAAHLPGEFGVLNLLAEQGWQIDRLE